MTHTLSDEIVSWLTRSDFVLGSDEAGYGPWAGNLYVALVCVPRGWTPPRGLTDSKDLSREQIEALAGVLKAHPQVRHLLYVAEPKLIDEAGVFNCLTTGHKSLHTQMRKDLEGHLLVSIADGNMYLGPDIISVPKADALVPAVSAASVIAKASQLQHMRELNELYPGYGFAKCAGYGTPAHSEALASLGPCPAHRMSYAPVARCIREQNDQKFLWEELPEDE
jgi:ribonuclease HII